MATLVELLAAASNDVLRQKVLAACFIAAEKIRVEAAGTTNHALRLVWAKSVFANPESERNRMVYAVVSQNAAATLSAITGASDVAVQAAVDAAVDVFAS